MCSSTHSDISPFDPFLCGNYMNELRRLLSLNPPDVDGKDWNAAGMHLLQFMTLRPKVTME
jgi:hypothetical protein